MRVADETAGWIARALRGVRASGRVVCETPAMEEDALRMQRFYRRIA